MVFSVKIQFRKHPVSETLFSYSKGHLSLKVVVTFEDCLSWKFMFRQKSSSMEVVFHQRLCSINYPLPSKVIFHQRLSSIKDHLQAKVVFHQRSYLIKGYLPSKVVFHQRLSSIKDRLPSKVVFYQRSSSTPELTPRYPRSESSNITLVI